MSTNQLGAELIRGAAGSGKTTTALLRLRSLTNFMRARKDRVDDTFPVRVLLLTFNRTLAGYVRALAEAQMLNPNHNLEVLTFSNWALQKLGNPKINDKAARSHMYKLARNFDGLEVDYLIQEVEYIQGRFRPENISDYLTSERKGRGALPRVDVNLRKRILKKVVYPYQKYLKKIGWLDWNMLALRAADQLDSLEYDIVVVDESQDFSANQLRAVRHHLADEHVVVFVIDTVQRIYARGFNWSETGFTITSNRSHRLRENHRNTREIAAFAAGILDGMTIDVDGMLPDLNSAQSNGPLPQVLYGKYSQQLEWAIEYIRNQVDLSSETVAFLKPKGGRWFEFLRSRLRNNGVDFVELTRRKDWPHGDENIALSTFHSAKGLEYDHVIILGFNHENTEFGEEEISDQVRVLRNLLAVAVARARKHVVVGYKPGEGSRLTEFFVDGTFQELEL